MNTNKSLCPPLTPGDILALKGNPLAKKIELLKNSFSQTLEEWVYYNIVDRTKESYRFKNGKLINYNIEEVV